MASLQPSSTPTNKNAIILKEEIGSGMFGTVHLAETSSGEKRAVKRIKVQSLKSQKHVQNLDREIEILRDANHCNIVKLYAVKKRGDEFWLILEYCGGGDLQQFIKAQLPKKKLSEKLALHFFKQLSDGLSFMKERELIHRDLKPANLLLSDNSHTSIIKIADFGFARKLSVDNGMADTQCGSPLYMAPEILSGQPHDSKVDTYSAGAILFEMLCGRPPFNGKDLSDLIANQRKQLKLPVRVSNECLTVITMLLQRQPEKRADATKLAQSEWLSLRVENMADSALSLSSSSGLESSTGSPSLSPSPKRLLPPAGAIINNNQTEDQSNAKGMAALALHTVNEVNEESKLESSSKVTSQANEASEPSGQTEELEESSEWEVIPTKDQMTAQVYLKRAHVVQRSLLNDTLRMNESEELAAVKRVMEYSKKAAECYSAANDPRVDTVLLELQQFLQHPKVEAALSRPTPSNTSAS